MRQTSSSTCCECVRLNHYLYYADHRDRALATIKSWQEANAGRVAAHSRKYRAENPGAARAVSKRWYDANKEKKLHANKVWRAMNKAMVQQYNVKRRAAIGQATPTWSNIKDIVDVYKRSVKITELTGIPHHVDHIIPLNGEYVCGLHVAWNLQILTASDNLTKGNRFDQ